MEYISQHPHPEACQHACLAMLAGVSLKSVIDLVGDKRLGVNERKIVCEKFSIPLTERRYLVEAFGENAIGNLIQKHKTILCSVYSALSIDFAHCVVIHDQKMFDPSMGINPSWPWNYYIGSVDPCEGPSYGF